MGESNTYLRESINLRLAKKVTLPSFYPLKDIHPATETVSCCVKCRRCCFLFIVLFVSILFLLTYHGGHERLTKICSNLVETFAHNETLALNSTSLCVQFLS